MAPLEVDLAGVEELYVQLEEGFGMGEVGEVWRTDQRRCVEAALRRIGSAYSAVAGEEICQPVGERV